MSLTRPKDQRNTELYLSFTYVFTLLTNYLIKGETHIILASFHLKNVLLGCVVQKLVNFNPGLSKNSRSNFFFKERLMIHLEYCLDFQRKKNY